VTFLLDTGCTGIVGIPDWLCDKNHLNLTTAKISELASDLKKYFKYIRQKNQLYSCFLARITYFKKKLG